ncbi:MAG: hypothetical protein ABEJ56_04770 [Candidatus Nanohaloarchaea archaeon]
MKGQFMLISSILAGVIVISASSTISEVQSRSVSTDEISNTAETVKYEAGRLYNDSDFTEQERENFGLMVSMISSYRTDHSYWDKGSESCFNITIRSSNQEVFLKCIN